MLLDRLLDRILHFDLVQSDNLECELVLVHIVEERNERVPFVEGRLESALGNIGILGVVVVNPDFAW